MIRSHQKDSSAVIRFSRENKINIANTVFLERKVERLIKKKISSVIIDLNGISFIDSTGFRTMLLLNEKARFEGVQMILINISDELMELFVLLKLENKFDILNSHTFHTPRAA